MLLLAAAALIAVYFLGRATAPATTTVETVANSLRDENERLQAARRDAERTISQLADSLHVARERASWALSEAQRYRRRYRDALRRIDLNQRYEAIPDSLLLARLRAGLGADDVTAPACVSVP
jgi:hypothetical protein